jgi:hypothetical protein
VHYEGFLSAGFLLSSECGRPEEIRGKKQTQQNLFVRWRLLRKLSLHVKIRPGIILHNFHIVRESIVCQRHVSIFSEQKLDF